MATHFSSKGFRQKIASEILASLGNFTEYSPNLQGPDYFSFYHSLQHRPNSSPGIDLIPFAGWKETGDLAISCMQKVDNILRSGDLPSAGDDYNASVIAFLVRRKRRAFCCSAAGPTGDEATVHEEYF